MNRSLVITLLMAMAVAACGSNGGGDNTPPTQSQGFVEYTTSLAATASDTTESVDVDAVATMTTDDTEPEQVT